MKKYNLLLVLSLCLILFSCKEDEADDPVSADNCVSDQVLDQSRGACTETLSFTPQYAESVSGNTRTINTNNIPDHKVGLFGAGQGSLNPNAISEQSKSYALGTNPAEAGSFTSLIQTTGTFPAAGPQYAFGILFNGVKLDPVAAEPFPHEGLMSANANWEWNLEATNVQIGLDCNNAHVQPSGEYHYHGSPTLFLQSINPLSTEMTIVGYAADGFPIYYKYAYEDANDANSAVVEMTSSYQLKSGNRPGDGISAPCDAYNGVYSNDYEFVSGLGTLDQANGRNGVTPQYPTGTYYYVITDAFPSIPRYFRGSPSMDFKIGM